MHAILRKAFGGPEALVIRELPEPEPKEGHAVIEVKAFGLNHAELHMRKGQNFLDRHVVAPSGRRAASQSGA
jgi:NADPH:quinone reductase